MNEAEYPHEDLPPGGDPSDRLSSGYLGDTPVFPGGPYELQRPQGPGGDGKDCGWGPGGAGGRRRRGYGLKPSEGCGPDRSRGGPDACGQ